MDGDAEDKLRGFSADLRKFATDGFVLAAKESRPLVDAAAKKTARAGTDPYGEPWRLRIDGMRAIPGAQDYIDTVARGAMVVIRVHRGAAIQNYLSPRRRRQVIPDSSKPIPPQILDAITEGVRIALEKSGVV